MLSITKKCPNILFCIVRYFLSIFTLFLSCFGLSLIAFSFWYLYEGNQYHLDSTTSFSICAFFFISGIILFSISLCGLAGVIRENLFISKLFLGTISLLITFELITVIFVYIYKKQILENANMIFENFIVTYVDDDDVRTIVDTIQSNFKCCGITSGNDWNNNIYYSCDSISSLACSVPASCCKNHGINSYDKNFFCGVGVRMNDTIYDAPRRVYLNGCKFAIYSFFELNNTIIVSLFALSLIPQFMALLLIIGFIISLSVSKKTIKHYKPHLIEFHNLNFYEIYETDEINHISLNPLQFSKKDVYSKSYDFQTKMYNEINRY